MQVTQSFRLNELKSKYRLPYTHKVHSFHSIRKAEAKRKKSAVYLPPNSFDSSLDHTIHKNNHTTTVLSKRLTFLKVVSVNQQAITDLEI